ncbi:MAG: hypothetical protein L0Z62_05760 [Gemmataceae bacterium]|nr:hypothetical protein [Gemmataceae bacterium]
MNRGLLAAGFVIALLLCPNPGATEPPRDPPQKAPDSLQAIRQKYEKLPVAPLTITEPIEVTEVFYYKDGGSVGLILTDSKKVKHEVCVDGRKRGLFPLVLNATYPTRKGARQVDFRSPGEAAFYGVMLRWVKRHPNRDDLLDPKRDIDDPKNPSLWEVHAFFHRLEKRFIEYGRNPKD